MKAGLFQTQHMLKRFIIALTITAATLGSHAQDSLNKIIFRVTGEVKQELRLTAGEIAKLPHVNAILKDRNGKDVPYSGVAVQTMLNMAGVTLGRDLRGENLSKFLLVRSADGYEVLFSLAEIDTTFTTRIMILADQVEGHALPADKGPLRMIVPGEKVPARSSFQVVEFVVRFAKD